MEGDIKTLKVGDTFWEYNSGVGYPRLTHSKSHIVYFKKRYKATTFFTENELLEYHPDAMTR